ncbi:hypothetical protein GF420_15820 [candidate division GN15 bacterium]|nr:hypothetical protein [candidate division GN15 bacterium]
MATATVKNTDRQEILPTFDAAINGTVTVYNPKTGGHRTFEVRTEEWKANGKWAARRVRVLSLFIGQDNENRSHFLPFGEVTDDGTVKVWRRDRRTKCPKKYWDKIPSRKVKQQLAALLEDPEGALGYGLEFTMACRCRRCNRKLTNPESLAIGYGPECQNHIEEGKTEVARLRKKK